MWRFKMCQSSGSPKNNITENYINDEIESIINIVNRCLCYYKTENICLSF